MSEFSKLLDGILKDTDSLYSKTQPHAHTIVKRAFEYVDKKYANARFTAQANPTDLEIAGKIISAPGSEFARQYFYKHEGENKIPDDIGKIAKKEAGDHAEQTGRKLIGKPKKDGAEDAEKVKEMKLNVLNKITGIELVEYAAVNKLNIPDFLKQVSAKYSLEPALKKPESAKIPTIQELLKIDPKLIPDLGPTGAQIRESDDISHNLVGNYKPAGHGTFLG